MAHSRTGEFLSLLKEALPLSTGIWSMYMYGHWIIACTNSMAGPAWPLGYPGTRGIVVLAASLLVWRLRPRLAVNSPWNWAAATGLAALSLVFAFLSRGDETPPMALLVAALLLSSLLQVWFLARWWQLFAAVETQRASLAVLLGMIVVSAMKIAMALGTDAFALLAALVPYAGAAALRIPLAESKCRSPWFSSPQVRGSLGRFIASVAAFLVIWAFLNTVLKQQTGHFAFRDSASPLISLLSQAIDLTFICLLTWWVFWRRKSFDYMQLWQFSYICLAAAIVSIAWVGMTQAVQVFTSAAFATAYTLMWLASADIARHSHFLPFCVFSVQEIVYDAADWLGRLSVGQLGTEALTPAVLCSLLFAIILIGALLLPRRTAASQYLLSDLNGRIPRNEDGPQLDRRCDEIAEEVALSSREAEIMKLLCRGRTRAYIAEALYLSENTVGTYVKRLYQKLGIHSKQELIDLASGPGPSQSARG